MSFGERDEIDLQVIIRQSTWMEEIQFYASQHDQIVHLLFSYNVKVSGGIIRLTFRLFRVITS